MVVNASLRSLNGREVECKLLARTGENEFIIQTPFGAWGNAYRDPDTKRIYVNDTK